MNYGPGDTIEYRPFGGGSRIVLVDERDADIKNGKPGFAGDLLEEDGKPVRAGYPYGCWGYDDQIVRVVRRAAR